MNLHRTVCVVGLLGFFLAGATQAQDTRANSPGQSAPQQNAPDQQAPPSQDPNAPASQAPSAVPPSSVTAPASTTFEISGTVHAGKTPLPGVTVTAANTLTGKKFSAATAANGTYTFTGLPRGRYVVRVEFMGFAHSDPGSHPETGNAVRKIRCRVDSGFSPAGTDRRHGRRGDRRRRRPRIPESRDRQQPYLRWQAAR